MQYRQFGNTGVKVSLLGFGAMRLPQKRIDGKTVLDEEESIRVIHRAFELGVNYIDTAPYYCNKESEIVVGKALKGWRDKVFVSTKNPLEDNTGKTYREMLELSLKKMDIDYIDFYHMWGMDLETFENTVMTKDGPMEAALKAKEEGLIRHLSFSTHDTPENIMKIIDTGYFETILCQYNLLNRVNEKVIEYARQKGLGVAIMGPVAGGMLGAPSKVIQDMLPGKVQSSAELALRFVMSNSNVSVALSGMNTVQMVEENAKIASIETGLTEQELSAIKASMEEKKQLESLYCTGCNYCMPCPNGVNIPLNFSIMNYHRIYGLTDYAKGEYSKIGTVDSMEGKKAEECIECGICEEKCPQKIEIRRQLRETAEALGR